jgi:hypothetical protein
MPAIAPHRAACRPKESPALGGAYRLATFSPLRMRLSGFRAMQKSVQCASVRIHLGNLG